MHLFGYNKADEVVCLPSWEDADDLRRPACRVLSMVYLYVESGPSMVATSHALLARAGAKKGKDPSPQSSAEIGRSGDKVSHQGATSNGQLAGAKKQEEVGGAPDPPIVPAGTTTSAIARCGCGISVICQRGNGTDLPQEQKATAINVKANETVLCNPDARRGASGPDGGGVSLRQR